MLKRNFFTTLDFLKRPLLIYLSLMKPLKKPMCSHFRYFVTPEAPGKIAATIPNAKLIFILRDPVARIKSDWTQRTVHLQYLPVNLITTQILNAGTGTINNDSTLLEPSRYAEHLERWLRFFPRSSIPLVNGDNLDDAPWEEIQKIEEFLGVPSEVTKDSFVWNEERGFYCTKAVVMREVEEEEEEEEPEVLCLGESKLEMV